jgi:putative methionine-R-sulfoxide reductase with GAF domain
MRRNISFYSTWLRLIMDYANAKNLLIVSRTPIKWRGFYVLQTIVAHQLI